MCVGLGSAHGDDQAGWQIAEVLATRSTTGSPVLVRKAANPSDLLDWLAGVEQLHIVDAWTADRAVGTMHRIECRRSMTDNAERLPELDRLRSAGTHQFGVAAVIDLAATLGRLPDRVVVHAVCGRDFRPGAALSPDLEQALPQLADAIWSELAHCPT